MRRSAFRRSAPRRRAAWLAAPLLALAGCGDVTAELTVRPDGSATLATRELNTDLPGLAERLDPGGNEGMHDNVERLRGYHCALRGREWKRILDAMGRGAASVATEACVRYHKDKAILERKEIAIRDVNAADFSPILFLNLPPSPDTTVARREREAPRTDVSWADNTLRIANYWQGDFADATAGDWFTDARRARIRASIPYMRGRVLDVVVRMEGGRVAETNARHVLEDGSGVVLARVRLDTLLRTLLDDKKRAALARLAELPDRDAQVREAEKIIPTLLLEGASEIFIRYE